MKDAAQYQEAGLFVGSGADDRDWPGGCSMSRIRRSRRLLRMLVGVLGVLLGVGLAGAASGDDEPVELVIAHEPPGAAVLVPAGSTLFDVVSGEERDLLVSSTPVVG